MNLGEEVSLKMESNPDWKKLPYEYAIMCIALGLSPTQAYNGFMRRLQPEEIMFEVDEFTQEDIDRWYAMD